MKTEKQVHKILASFISLLALPLTLGCMKNTSETKLINPRKDLDVDISSPLKQEDFNIVVLKKICKYQDNIPNSSTPEEYLAKAVQWGDASCVAKYIGEKANVNRAIKEYDGSITYPLLLAIDSYDFKQLKKDHFSAFTILKLLIDAGAKTDVVNSKGDNVFQMAVAEPEIVKSYPSVIEYLYSIGTFQLEVKDSGGMTPLHRALQAGSERSFNFFLEKGASRESLTSKGESLLDLAMALEDESRGASWIKILPVFVRQDSYGNNYLHSAIEKKKRLILAELLRKPEIQSIINQKNHQNKTPLNLAVVERDIDMVKHLLAAGADADLGDARNLHIAIAYRDLELFRLLLDHTKNIEFRSEGGWTPLLLAVLNNNREATQLLLQRQANVNAQNEKGETALYLAIDENNNSLIDLLLQQKPDVTLRNEDGNTLLHRTQKVALVKRLIEAGVPADEKNNKGETPLSRAIANGNRELGEFLLSRNANKDWKSSDGKSLLHIAVEANDLETTVFLLQRKVDVNTKNSEDETPLFFAKTPTMIETLVQAGADVNAKRKDRQTVFATFVYRFFNYNQNFELNQLLIDQLVKHDVSLDSTNLTGDSLIAQIIKARTVEWDIDPMTMFIARAIGSLDHGQELAERVFEYLIKVGVPLDIQNWEGDTALHLTEKPLQAQLLLQAGASRSIVNRKGQTPSAKHSETYAKFKKKRAEFEQELPTRKSDLEEAKLKYGSGSLVTYHENEFKLCQNKINVLEMAEKELQVLLIELEAK